MQERYDRIVENNIATVIQALAESAVKALALAGFRASVSIYVQGAEKDKPPIFGGATLSTFEMAEDEARALAFVTQKLEDQVSKALEEERQAD